MSWSCWHTGEVGKAGNCQVTYVSLRQRLLCPKQPVLLPALETTHEQFYMGLLSISRMAWETAKYSGPAQGLPEASDNKNEVL